MNHRAIKQAAIAGTVLQLAMVLVGHSNPAVARMFAVGGMGISLVAGVIYAHLAGKDSMRGAARGGAEAGGICALIGIIVSYALGDVTALVLVAGTLSSVVTGALGGWIGNLTNSRSHSPA
ncbi:MAG: hypothetical protein ABJA80_12960 [bacterium]